MFRTTPHLSPQRDISLGWPLSSLRAPTSLITTFRATVDDPSNVLSGGTVTIDNVNTIVIPKNLLVNLPGITSVTWAELFSGGNLNLPLYPEVSWEVSVSIAAPNFKM